MNIYFVNQFEEKINNPEEYIRGGISSIDGIIGELKWELGDLYDLEGDLILSIDRMLKSQSGISLRNVSEKDEIKIKEKLGYDRFY